MSLLMVLSTVVTLGPVGNSTAQNAYQVTGESCEVHIRGLMGPNVVEKDGRWTTTQSYESKVVGKGDSLSTMVIRTLQCTVILEAPMNKRK